MECVVFAMTTAIAPLAFACKIGAGKGSGWNELFFVGTTDSTR